VVTMSKFTAGKTQPEEQKEEELGMSKNDTKTCRTLEDMIANARAYRADVAWWAQYCMGSVHGDWSPEAEAIGNKVMHDDDTFLFYARTHEEQLKQKPNLRLASQRSAIR
jgi:hypothetical protein